MRAVTFFWANAPDAVALKLVFVLVCKKCCKASCRIMKSLLQPARAVVATIVAATFGFSNLLVATIVASNLQKIRFSPHGSIFLEEHGGKV